MRLLPALLALLAPAAVTAAEVLPVLRLDFYGGQFFFERQAPSISASGDWLFSPALRFSDGDLLIPSVSGSYRRSRDIHEYLGGGFITDETLNNTAALKWVHYLDEAYAVKPAFSYKNELVSETADEKLGNGLFDHHKISGGLEIERQGEFLRSMRHAFHAFGVRYYNFKALTAGQFGTEVQSGENVLDFNSFDYTCAAQLVPWEKTTVNVTGTGSYREFLDQKIVTRAGTYSEANRKVLFAAFSAGVERLLPGLGSGWYSFEPSGGFTVGWDQLGSNQDHYDAPRLRYDADFYDYKEVQVGLFLKALIGGKLTVSGQYDYTRRFYKTRAARNTEGVEMADRAFNNTHVFTYEFSRPIARGFSIKARGGYRVESSNDKYERTYRSNFHAAHYFLGAGWAY